MRSLSLLAVAAIALQGCVKDSRAEQAPTGRELARQAPETLTATIVSAPPRLVVHPEHIRPGGAAPRGVTFRNPLEGSADAAATGAKLFVAYNCIDCHGADGSGAMGPSLADGRWHFGGTAAEVYESIAQGRPEGMPAWGALISDRQIWQLVAYVRSLEAGKDVATENFTGKTVERTGH